jgi:hypothetical protein
VVLLERLLVVIVEVEEQRRMTEEERIGLKELYVSLCVD